MTTELPRRRAVRSRTGSGFRSGLPAVLVLLVCAASVLLLRPAPPPGPSAGPTAVEPVDHELLGCPADRPPQPARLRVLGAPLDGLGDDGVLTVGPPDGPAEPLSAARGEVAGVRVRGVQVVEARGGPAAGLVAAREAAGTVVACDRPRADWWFLGAGADVDHTSVLTITNVDSGPAVVDVRLSEPNGEVAAVGTRGITVQPGESRRLPLVDLAPGSDDLLVGVRATQGRVTAALSDRGPRPGPRWLPAADRPSRSVRLAGVPGEAGRGTLLVGNPSQLEALVQVQVNGPTAPFTPAGLERLRVPPGAVVAIDARAVLRGDEPLALSLRSRVPVVAALRIDGRAGGYAAPVQPLVEPSTVLLPGAGSVVQVTAGALEAGAVLAAYDEQGRRLRDERLDVPAGTTQTWSPPRRAAYVVLARARGTVWGAVTGALGTQPLASLPLHVRSPQVVPALR